MLERKFLTRRYKIAFTLIELLVVVAIIALLAAILFPVFSRARENARRSACQSNLKQIGMGMLQYTQDYDEVLPSAAYGSTDKTTGSYYRWMDAIYPYVKSQQVFGCPSDRVNKPFVFQATKSGAQPNTRSNGSYAINSLYYNNKLGPVSYLDSDEVSPLVPRKLTSMSIPAETVWVVEAYGKVFSLTGKDKDFDPDKVYTNLGYPYISDGGGDGVIALHLETTNVLWCDGHVKATQLTTLLDKTTSDTLSYFTVAVD